MSESVFRTISEETTRIQQGKPPAKTFVVEQIGLNLFSLREIKMPDLTIQYFYHCQSAEFFTQKVQGSKEYVVAYGATPRGPYQYDWTCSCDSFKFGKGKHCKHIKEVVVNHCNWQQFIDGGEPVEKNGEKCCPKCGAAVISQGHGV